MTIQSKVAKVNKSLFSRSC